jgi:excinuclease ABC subunit C
MIKEYNPKYNILLKDDKGYHYIKIYPREWPRILAVKQRLEDGGEYLGPYVSSFVVSQTVDEANKAFRLPTCNRRFPQEIGKGRPCLNYYISSVWHLPRAHTKAE